MSFQPVPYTQDDLRGLKKDAVTELIKNQADKWPKGLKKLSTGTTKELMCSVLLNPENGFTKSVPLSRNESEELTPLPDTPCHASASVQPEHVNDPQDQGGHELAHTPVISHHDNLRETVRDSDIPLANSTQTEERDRIECSDKAEIPLYLLIEDYRFNPPLKAALPIAAVLLRENDDLYVSSRAVISQIQNSGTLEGGVVKLSCPFRLDNSYDEPFAINVAVNRDGGNFTVLRHRDQLFVPSTHTLNIRVQHNPQSCSQISITDVPTNTEMDNGHHVQTVIPSTSASSMGANSAQPTATSSTRAHPRRPSTNENMLRWLKDQLKRSSHYQVFAESSRHVIQNPTIVQVWKFVADFHAIYCNAKSPVSGGHVSKKALAEALDIGDTWLTDALAGDRLVRVYGRNGPQMNAKVVEELDTIRDPPRGRTALLTFLQTWEKDHPCIQ